jgi:hypothetical protein
MKYISVIVLSMLLAACSPMDFIKPMLSGGSGPSLEVDTTVGDKEESIVGQVGDTRVVTAESLTGGVHTTTIHDTPPWVLLLAVLGWMMPRPSEIYKELKTIIKGDVEIC